MSPSFTLISIKNSTVQSSPLEHLESRPCDLKSFQTWLRYLILTICYSRPGRLRLLYCHSPLLRQHCQGVAPRVWTEMRDIPWSSSKRDTVDIIWVRENKSVGISWLHKEYISCIRSEKSYGKYQSGITWKNKTLCAVTISKHCHRWSSPHSNQWMQLLIVALRVLV